MDGGSRVAEVLRAQGVRWLFTLVGGHISPILVAAKGAGLRVVDVRDEATAVFAADAVGRLTGVPGVAVVTAGPGVTNTITAVKTAQMAQSPLVVIGGATATLLRGRGSLQDIDQTALMAPHVKWMARPNSLREVIPALEQAFVECRKGVPGPVFVELAVDLLYAREVVEQWHRKILDKPNKTLAQHAMGAYVRGHLALQFAFGGSGTATAAAKARPASASRTQLRRAARMLGEARQPVMVLGSQTMAQPSLAGRVVESVEALGIPVFVSGMARGLLGKGHALQVRHKRRDALRDADLVILSGVPNDFRLDYGAHLARTKAVSVNLSAIDLNKNRRPNLGILADPATFIIDLARLAGGRPSRAGWFRTLRGRERARELEIDELAAAQTDSINPLALCRAIDDLLSDGSVVVGDGGDFVATASYVVSPRGPYGWLDPGVFGTLGVGAGFALGAKLVNPGADVWLLYGDGAAGFSVMEFDTFARHGLGIVAVVGNDAGWTQIERDQVEVLGDDVACRLTHMDYHGVAKACGGQGYLLKGRGQVGATLRKALKVARAGRPALVNAHVGKTDFRNGSLSM